MAKKPAENTPAVTILCSHPGFRRAGMAHGAEASHPAGTFTAEQLALLEEEPRITVIHAPAAKADG